MGKHGQIVLGPAGAGKCWIAGSMLRLFDGSTIKVDNVRPGDTLIAEDSTPRVVNAGSLCTGIAPLYSVFSSVRPLDPPLIVNLDHILVLVWPREIIQSNAFQHTISNPAVNISDCGSDSSSVIVELPVSCYLSLPSSVQSGARLLKSPAVDFASSADLINALKSIEAEFPSSQSGSSSLLWLLGFVSMAVDDSGLAAERIRFSFSPPIGAALHAFAISADSHSHYLSRSACASFFELNRSLLSAVRRLFGLSLLTPSAPVPDSILRAPIALRLAFLSGIIEYMRLMGCELTIASDCVGLSSCEIVTFGSSLLSLVRSLGFSYSARPTTENAWKLQIIPDPDCALLTFSSSSSLKSVSAPFSLRVPFTVCPHSFGRYYGFTVSGPNARVLMADYTVSHNSSYCSALQRHCEAVKRRVFIVNLDPAAEHFDYEVAIDIRDLISLKDVMEELEYGPNGGLIYCMEYLVDNIEWLEEQIADYSEDYLIFDCPGQIELYSHLNVMKTLIAQLQKWNYQVAAVYLLDSMYINDSSRFISGALACMSAMVQLELPHINLLSKCDLVQDKNALERFLNPNVDELLEELNRDMGESFIHLNAAVANLIEQYSLVSFLPLDISDEESMAVVLANIDGAIQYGEDQEAKEPHDEHNIDEAEHLQE